MTQVPDIIPVDLAAMRRYERLRKVGIAVGVLVLVILMALALPAQWHGRMSYMNLDGISMNPTLYAGDLAVVRKSDDYKVGDVVAYKPAGAHGGSFYLHRIRKVTPDGYIFRGDNNKDDDPRIVQKEQLIGTMVFHIPKAGLLISNRLFLLAVAGAIMLLTFGITMLPAKYQPKTLIKRARAGIGECLHSVKGPQPFKWGLFMIALTLLVAAGMVHRAAKPADAPGKIRSEISYSAKADVSEAYPDGNIESGDTIYTKLAHNVELQWKLSGTQAQGLKMYLRDGQDWKREVPLKGSWVNGTWSARVDLDEIVKLTDKIQLQTSVPNSTYTLQFKPSGVAQGASIPAVDFLLNDGVLRPSNKSALKWSPNVAPKAKRNNSALWSVMLLAAAIGFIVLGIMDNQPLPVARRMSLVAEPDGSWLDIDSVQEIEQIAIKLDVPVMEHSTGMYVIAHGSNWGYRYAPRPKLEGVESKHEVA